MSKLRELLERDDTLTKDVELFELLVNAAEEIADLMEAVRAQSKQPIYYGPIDQALAALNKKLNGEVKDGQG